MKGFHHSVGHFIYDTHYKRKLGNQQEEIQNDFILL